MITDIEPGQVDGHVDLVGQTVLSLWRGVMEVPPPVRVSPTVAAIQTATADYFGLTRLELVSDRRARRIARPRQVSMWICRELTTRSLPDIGVRHGDRDHTTVMHAVRRIDALKLEEPDIATACEALVKTLGGYPA